MRETWNDVRKTRRERPLRLLALGALLCLLLSFVGCGTAPVGQGGEGGTAPVEQTVAPTAEWESDSLQQYQGAAGQALSLSDVPAYDGEAWVAVRGNVPSFSEQEKQRTDAFETYSELDALGRCGVAYANVCREIMPTEERGSIGQVRPSGWHTVRYNGLVDGNYLYNRCHLIGYQLAGENANEKNLITGTRYLNVEGMLPFEDQVDDYVDATGNHVLYRVTPIYDGANLVASGVELEAWSVEDQGRGLCFHVYCYNVQPGIGIDYATGESWKLEDAHSGGNKGTENGNGAGADREQERAEYVLNVHNKKVHLPTCASVAQIAPSNRKDYVGTLHQLRQEGYEPCGSCLKEFR